MQQIRTQRETFITVGTLAPGCLSGFNLPGEVWRFLTIEATRVGIEVDRLRIARNELNGTDPVRASPATTQPAPSAAAAATTTAPDQMAAVEAEYLNALQLQLALQERLTAVKDQMRDADRKLVQYNSLTDEEALIEKQYARVSEDINSLKLAMRDRSSIVGVHMLSQAVAPVQYP